MQMSNKRVLVTGGSRGIGLAIARIFREEGAHVIGTSTDGRLDNEVFHESYAVDFTNVESSDEFFRLTKDSSIDVLVNNAGINKIAAFQETSWQDYQRIIAVNLTAPIFLTKAVIPYMKNQGWGRIVNISSIFGKISKEFRAVYSASKFGLDGATVALAAELSRFNILANCVAPGFTDTELTRKILSETEIETLADRVPAKRLADPVEIARLVLWLGSPNNTYVTGQNIAIDGGFSRV